jgi:hypothetical protein
MEPTRTSMEVAEVLYSSVRPQLVRPCQTSRIHGGQGVLVFMLELDLGSRIGALCPEERWRGLSVGKTTKTPFHETLEVRSFQNPCFLIVSIDRFLMCSFPAKPATSRLARLRTALPLLSISFGRGPLGPWVSGFDVLHVFCCNVHRN